MKGLTEGRIVHYVLTQANAAAINDRRSNTAGHRDDWPEGAQAHIGNPVSAGDHCPMIVVRVWDHSENGQGTCNGQVLLDGNDSLWVTSAVFDVASENVPGTWHWIEPA